MRVNIKIIKLNILHRNQEFHLQPYVVRGKVVPQYNEVRSKDLLFRIISLEKSSPKNKNGNAISHHFTEICSDVLGHNTAQVVRC